MLTCGGIHPGQVEPASPIELTTSRTEALQARRSCRAHKRLSPSPFSLVRGRKLAVKGRGVKVLDQPTFRAFGSMT